VTSGAGGWRGLLGATLLAGARSPDAAGAAPGALGDDGIGVLCGLCLRRLRS